MEWAISGQVKDLNREWIIFFIILSFVLLIFLIVFHYERKIHKFSEELGRTLEDMLSGNNMTFSICKEDLVGKLNIKLKRLYEILQDRTRKAEEDKLEMQSLISDISHQVKTPIANIKMYHEILSSRELDKDKRTEFLTLSKAQVEKLEFLMQSMVKMSRLESGVIELSPKMEKIYDTLAIALGGVLLKAENKYIFFEIHCDEEIMAFFDKKWTVEAFFNILDNAVKYSPENGCITVTVTEEEFYTVVSVKDEGVGITEAEQALIFKRFYRSTSVHDMEGVGLGLFLAREIITKQEGYIQVKSEFKKGSEFLVYLNRI